MNWRPSLWLILLLTAVMALAAACKQVATTEYSIDTSSCNGCGECVRACPNDAIRINGAGKAEIDPTKCTQCARCVAVCPNNAVY